MQEYTTEEEQLQFITHWLKQHGLKLVIIAATILAAVFSWQYWQSYKTNRIVAASNLYRQLEQFQTQDPGVNEVEQQKIVDNLLKNYSSTVYSKIAAVYIANKLVAEQKWQEAAEQYKTIYNQSSGWPDFQVVVLENWLRSLLELKQYDLALKHLAKAESKGFAKSYPVNFYNLKGDILAAQKSSVDNKEAIAAYDLALNAIKNNPASAESMTQFANWMILKRNDLLVAEPLG